MLKRLFDLIFCAFSMPIWLLMILVTIITSGIFNGRPIFFIQIRGGYKNKKIKIYKFRTIDKNNHINGYSNLIRLLKLDELPQFINILKGDLSLVGPRPLMYEYKNLFSKKHLKRFDVPPGVTGWSQIKSNKKTKWLKKIDYDLWYVENQNFFLDLKIIFYTIFNIWLSLISKNKISNPDIRFNGKN